MKIEVKVPQLSESVSEASLLTWHKQAGEAVTEGENLIDIETDKVVLELPAIKSGVLTEILRQNGEKVTSGEVIAILDTEAKPSVASAAAPAASAKAVVAGAAVMPAAKKIAAENGYRAISGSGRGGRVTKEDVLSAPENQAQRWPAFRSRRQAAASSSACR
jgi:2-oxoglutarate dehydrogenase E2 component (dihydrolipoamide succinyltransferase)